MESKLNKFQNSRPKFNLSFLGIPIAVGAAQSLKKACVKRIMHKSFLEKYAKTLQISLRTIGSIDKLLQNIILV